MAEQNSLFRDNHDKYLLIVVVLTLLAIWSVGFFKFELRVEFIEQLIVGAMGGLLTLLVGSRRSQTNNETNVKTDTIQTEQVKTDTIQTEQVKTDSMNDAVINLTPEETDKKE